MREVGQTKPICRGNEAQEDEPHSGDHFLALIGAFGDLETN